MDAEARIGQAPLYPRRSSRNWMDRPDEGESRRPGTADHVRASSAIAGSRASAKASRIVSRGAKRTGPRSARYTTGCQRLGRTGEERRVSRTGAPRTACCIPAISTRRPSATATDSACGATSPTATPPRYHEGLVTAARRGSNSPSGFSGSASVGRMRTPWAKDGDRDPWPSVRPPFADATPICHRRVDGTGSLGKHSENLLTPTPTRTQKAKRPTPKSWPKCLILLAPRPGLEPGTCGLTVRRSTD
jgi:hypothetical protein